MKLQNDLYQKSFKDSNYAIAYELSEVAEGLQKIAGALERLGMNNAAGPMGAIEGHTVTMKEAYGEIASALRDIAESR
jgi:hypothetical protein